MKTHMPHELLWIGPLFAVLYIILWLRRGFGPFWALSVYVFGITVFFPPVLILAIVFLFVFAKIRKYRVAIIVFFLSFFYSGILLEPFPIHYPGLYPPPVSIMLNLMFTPMMAMFFIFLLFVQLPMLLAATLLLILSVLTGYTMVLVTKRQLDSVQATLLLIIVLLCWTFNSLLVGMSSLNNYITPIPFGPLIALNLIPFMRNDEDRNSSADYLDLPLSSNQSTD
ncbi:MAG: hypothetical protein AM325_009170 [Candidatus Thorarchaeota archaeon SMTZ1-45]